MDRLPNELLHTICVQLEPQAVPAFRLVNRHCAAIGAPFLFPNGQVDFHLAQVDLTRLDAIASHFQLRHYVRTLQYEAHTLHPAQKSFWAWKRKVKEDEAFAATLRRPRPKPLGTRSEWRCHYQIYQEMLQQQAKILRSMPDLLTLAYFFQQCPNLCTLIFSNAFEFHNHERIHHPFEATYEKPGPNLEPAGVRQLLAALLAAMIAERPLVELTAGCISWGLFPLLDDIRSECACTTFSSLTVLRLVINTTVKEDDLSAVGMEELTLKRYKQLEERDCLRRLLSTLPHLLVLDLVFELDDEDVDSDSLHLDEVYMLMEFTPELHEVLPIEHVWPSLSELRLCGFTTTQEDVSTLLCNHQTSLRSLELADVGLSRQRTGEHTKEGGSWMDLLPYIRDTLQLERGALYGQISAHGAIRTEDEEWHIYYDESSDSNNWQTEINQFLTRVTDVCPLTEENMRFE